MVTTTHKAPPLELGRDALFLDLDGTLVDIADDPASVRLEGAGRALLRELSSGADGAVAVLTGRTLDAADLLIGQAIAPVAAQHGLTIRFERGARIDGFATSADLSRVRVVATDLAALASKGQLEARIEDKGASVALHFRHQPRAEARVHEIAEAMADKAGLRTIKGKMVIEILPSGGGKGDALRTFMQHAPFAARRPVMVGDDVTDESAFAAANALGGVSVLVGPMRESAAQYRLEDVAAVHEWLARALEAGR